MSMSNIIIIVIITFAISTKCFALNTTPLSTWRIVPFHMLSTSRIPKLVWPLKLGDSCSSCKNRAGAKKLFRVSELNTDLSLNHNSKVHVNHQFETVLSTLVNRRVTPPTFLDNLGKTREPNNFQSQAINKNASYLNHSNLKEDNNLNVDRNSVMRSAAPNKKLVENEYNIEIHTKETELSTTQEFYTSLEEFERRFYYTTFNKLTALHEATRAENGISFIHSGLLLWLTLVGLSTEVDKEARNEINANLHLNASDVEKEKIISEIVTSLPTWTWTSDMKFHWGSRLVLRKGKQLSERFRRGAAASLRLQIDYFEGSESPGDLADILNKMVENDSGGTIRNTFDNDDFLVDDVEALLVTTMYLRARWRAAPTLLNGTYPFNSIDLPQQTVRMIRINDVVKYARLDELNAEAIEIFYFNPDLSFLILLPNGNSLNHLTHKMSKTKLEMITDKMRFVRVATILPLYTLRMTLLLPNKLRAMGISRFMSTDNTTEIGSLHITHAVQRLMFWAEAGRHAFKDDGIEWDEKPEREVLIDQPYIFYVRWKNMTLMNGNFVL